MGKEVRSELDKLYYGKQHALLQLAFLGGMKHAIETENERAD